MGSFGDKLKRERELRGVTLDEIAKATKIGTRALKALEDEQFDQLPGGIFNKGFVRAYAKFLGLDEEEMVSDYVTAQGDRDASKPDLMAKLAVQAEAQRRSDIAASGGDKSSASGNIWITLAVVVLLTAGVAAGIRYYQMRKAARAEAERVRVQTQVPQPAAPIASPVPDSAAIGNPNSATPDGQTTTTPTGAPDSSDSNNAVPAPGASSPTPAAVPKSTDTTVRPPLELQIHVTKATWLSVQADGKPEVAETLRDSATKVIIAQEKVVLTTGNSVDITCNGKPLGILGADNQRSQLKITADCKVN
ncbi:MAG: RodZ domain-containing protein [Acidobacteriaceae bacterium]